MMKKTPSLGSEFSKVVSLHVRWPEGLDEFLSDSQKAGFEPWVPQHSWLFSDWSLPGFAQRPASLHRIISAQQNQNHFCYTYVSQKLDISKQDLIDLLKRVSFLILDSNHPLAEELKSSNETINLNLIAVPHADAYMDWILREVFVEDWFAESDSLIDSEISKTARLEKNVLVGPGSIIEDHVKVLSGARIGAGVRIGSGTVIGSGAVLCDGVQVGSDSVIGPHAVVGGPGFGLVKYPNEKYPKQKIHVGGVQIGSRVRIGAFVSIDRGVFENTLIGDDTQIDNHVQIAHNCELGSGNVLCSFVGLAGSVKMGSGNTLAGQVGVKDHVKIGDDVVIASQSGVSRDLKDKECVKGYPLLSLKESLKVSVLISKLPEIWDRLKKLEKSLDK